MTYKEAWEEMKEWLEKGTEYMTEKVGESKTNGRLLGKLEGFKIILNHMKDYEKTIY